MSTSYQPINPAMGSAPGKTGMSPAMIGIIIAVIICICILSSSSFSGIGTGGYFYFGKSTEPESVSDYTPISSPVPTSVPTPIYVPISSPASTSVPTLAPTPIYTSPYTELQPTLAPTPIYTPPPQQQTPPSSPPYSTTPPTQPTPLYSPIASPPATPPSPPPATPPSPPPATPPSPPPATPPSPPPATPPSPPATPPSTPPSPPSATPPTSTPACPTSYPDVSVTGSTTGSTVWGSGPYTNDSDLNKAAVHAGLITVGQKATIKKANAGYIPNYTGSTKNGITTSNYTGWCGVNLSVGSITPSPVSPTTPPATTPPASPPPATTTTTSTRNYTFYSGYDSPGNDIRNVPWDSTKDPQAHMAACDAATNCAGFNSDGWLKNIMYDPAGKSKSWTDPAKGMWAVKLTSTSGTVGTGSSTTTSVPVSTTTSSQNLAIATGAKPTDIYTPLQLASLVKARLDTANGYWNYEYVNGKVVPGTGRIADFLFKKVDKLTKADAGLDARRAYFTSSSGWVVLDSTQAGGGIDSSDSGFTVLPGPVAYYGPVGAKLTAAAITYYNAQKPDGTNTMGSVVNGVAINDTQADLKYNKLSIQGGALGAENRRFTFAYDPNYKVIVTAMGAVGSGAVSFPAPPPPPTYTSQFTGPQYLMNRDIAQWLKFDPTQATSTYKIPKYGVLSGTTDTNAQWTFELSNPAESDSYFIKHTATNLYMIMVPPASTVSPLNLSLQTLKPTTTKGIFRIVKSTGGIYRIQIHDQQCTTLGNDTSGGINSPLMVDECVKYNFDIKSTLTSTDVTATKAAPAATPNPIGTKITLMSNGSKQYIAYKNLVLTVNGTATNAAQFNVIPTGTANQYQLKTSDGRYLTARYTGSRNTKTLGADNYPTGNDIWTIVENTPGSKQWFLSNSSFYMTNLADGTLYNVVANVDKPLTDWLYTINKLEGFDEAFDEGTVVQYFSLWNIIILLLLILVIVYIYRLWNV
ncbi:LCCL domain protein [Klosneuvirus KNV1]|uniref:LCCL domain protein n=1 Tax=Klosneuvirus KNV1 TaxID=1977640 RepID=A0A1V0SJQ6_9VIRU|nr:LCCL domain protein [Klosneuvirus KNV1]